jgi:hypothetical protein
MPLSLQEKAVIADIFSADYPYTSMYFIKRRFVMAYALLWNQKDSFIRNKIAAHFSKVITDKLKWNDKTIYPEINNFFILSLLQTKVENDFLKKLFLSSGGNKIFILQTIKTDFEEALHATLGTIFKDHINSQKEAKKVFSASMRELKTWVDKSPHNYFTEEKTALVASRN